MGLFLLMSGGCNKDGDDPDSPEVLATDITINGRIDAPGIDLSGLSVETISGQGALDGSDFEAPSLSCDKPQLIAVGNGDDIILMARDFYSAGKEVTVDVRSTTIALVTFHPLFAPIGKDGYSELVNLVTGAEHYRELYDEVAISIADRRDIFDVSNSALLVALSNVFEDLCSEQDDSDALRMTRAAATKAGLDINSYPLLVEASGNVLSISNTKLSPSYYGGIYDSQGDLLSKLVIPSRSDYGGMDLFLKTYENVHLGEPVRYTFTQTGNRNFRLSRTTLDAQVDFGCHIAACLLGAAGIPLEYVDLGGIGQLVANSMVNMAQAGLSGDMDAMNMIKTECGVLMDYLDVSGALDELTPGWRPIGKILSKAILFYDVIKGGSNVLLRVAWFFAAPEEIDFCLCYLNGQITSCTESRLYITSGNNQEGQSEQRLLLPLEVYVETNADDGTFIRTYQKVRFKVTSGGGYIESIVGTDQNGKASAYWVLGPGNKGDKQTVTATVIDLVTGEDVSEPVVFTATVKEPADITIRLDWHKLSGNTDIDLHVWDPFGDEIAYYNMTSPSGGWLDRDDVIGPGPEHIYWTNAPAGTYKVYVHYYASETGAVTSYTVTVNAGGVAYRPITGSISYDQMVPVGQFTIPSSSTRSPISPELEQITTMYKKVTFPKKTHEE
ncbi:MAG: hypothetical protein LBI58_04815 [Tannerellaceae bacterium]|nr:hypothetical protein [Tannerellaceae bacterium]